MSNLGISTIFSQLNQPETAESKKLSRTDSDSLLAILSKNLESSLQQAFDLAGKYVGIDAPQVEIDRDFDLQTLDGPQVAQYLALWQNGAISHETLLDALKKGEVLPGIDVELELEMCGQEKLDNMSMAMDIGSSSTETPQEDQQAGETNSDTNQADQSDIRTLLEERLRRLNGPSDNEEDAGN